MFEDNTKNCHSCREKFAGKGDDVYIHAVVFAEEETDRYDFKVCYRCFNDFFFIYNYKHKKAETTQV